MQVCKNWLYESGLIDHVMDDLVRRYRYGVVASISRG